MKKKKTQAEFKKELTDLLHEVGAKIVGEDDEKWMVHFEMNGIPFLCLYDDGISCYTMGRFFYNPLEWGEPYFSQFKQILRAIRN
jgi:hypothetical protein